MTAIASSKPSSRQARALGASLANLSLKGLSLLLASDIEEARRISFISLATSSLYFEEGAPKEVRHQMHLAALPHEVGGADSALEVLLGRPCKAFMVIRMVKTLSISLG